ncbi:MAG: class I SAM-dependent methyltransferase [Proteobacteria bacterium]|nr:class I SAM-dependent methyltransferase [Pseudomonadota bacterium]
MSTTLEFTGERFVPGVPGEIELEHVHRYAFAQRLVAGRRVLDCACGEGYGSALLAKTAASVAGVDIDGPTLAHARETYGTLAHVAFHQASAAALPFADASFDAIVSFETIEHLPADLQPAMLAEFARVLAPGGLVILSAPNRVEYSDKRGYANEFHLHEHDRAELDALLARHFAARRFHHQRVWMGSAIWSEAGGTDCEALVADTHDARAQPLPAAMYYVVVAAREAAHLPPVAAVSLCSDGNDAELARLHGHAAEVLRLDRLLLAANDDAAERDGWILHLEGLVAERDARLANHQAAQDAALAAMRDENARLAGANAAQEAALAAQERIIDYRQSVRWWLKLPLVRLRAAWRRIAG